MKKIIFLIIGVALCFFFSCTKEENLSSEKQLTKFMIVKFGPNFKGAIDQEKRTITFTAPYGTDITKITPVFEMSAGASVVPALGVEQDFTKPVTYTVTAENGTKQEYTVIVVVAKNSKKEITEFSFVEQSAVGVIDDSKKTIDLTVPIGTNVKELVPTIVFTKGATISPASGVVQDFSQPVTYTVTAEDDSKEDYVVSVTVAKSSEKMITEFRFAGLSPKVIGTIDEVKKIVSLVVPAGTSLKAMVPTIVTSKFATITPASGVARDFSSSVVYTVTAQDGSKKAYTVKVLFDAEVAKSSEKKILGFNLAGLTPQAVGTIDEASKSVTLSVPAGTDVKTLVPTITLSKGATVTPASDVVQDFTKSVSYLVKAEDGSVQPYAVTVVPVEAAKSSEALITEFKFGALTPTAFGIVDQTSRTIKVKVPAGTDVTKLIPSVVFSQYATISPILGKNTDFTSPVVYTVTAQDGRTTNSYTVSVEFIVPDPQGAPIITSVKKTTLTAGLDKIVIVGSNIKKLGTTTFIYLNDVKLKGTVNNEATEVEALVPSTAKIGPSKVKLMVGINNYSNELDVTIVENNSPMPTISNVQAEMFAGDNLVITGSNFMATGNVVRLSLPGVFPVNYTLVAVSESETSLTFSTSKVVKPGNYELYVMSNGKEVKHTVTVKVSLKPAEFISVSPLKLRVGEVITITGKNFNKETLSFISIDEGGHKIKYIDSEHVSIVASTDLKPGKYPLVIKKAASLPNGNPTFVEIYATEVEIIP